jgi:hypothetical protein
MADASTARDQKFTGLARVGSVGRLVAPAGSGQLWVYDVGANGQLYFTRVL